MPPRKSRGRCQICDEKESRYACPGSGCLVEYCSVACYKHHKETSCSGCESERVEQNDVDVSKDPGHGPQTLSSHGDETTIGKEDVVVPPLRALTSLKWPYVPETSAYADPLKRDDPKPLHLAQYSAIATSPAVREALRAHPKLKDLLRTIDGLRGAEREEALQLALEVGGDEIEEGIDESERLGMRGLAQAIEAACREGEGSGTQLGLVWK